MHPLYVCFHTADSGYADEAAGLRESLDAFELPYQICSFPRFGSWVEGCAFKSSFIRSMRQHPGRPLVWLDADARVKSIPHLFVEIAADPTIDFAAHWLPDSVLLSGTLYFGTGAKVGRLIDSWCDQCAASPKQWDQKSLQGAISCMPGGLKAYLLPPEYTWIAADGNYDDVSRQAYGDREPVILHRQASRRLAFA